MYSKFGFPSLNTLLKQVFSSILDLPKVHKVLILEDQPLEKLGHSRKTREKVEDFVLENLGKLFKNDMHGCFDEFLLPLTLILTVSPLP